MAAQQGNRRERERERSSGREYRSDRTGAVYIGPEQIYHQVLGAREDLIRTEGKIGQIDKDLGEFQETVAEQLRAFNERLSPVERRSWAMPSAAGLVGLAGLILGIMQMNGVGS
jgi:hypothetical protein